MGDGLDLFFKPIVLVTGFGPFANNPINASWEAVKLLNKDEIEKKHNIELVTLEIPVTYENVDEFVPALWETHTPKLTIHVGVSNMAKSITLEAQAHKKGYSRTDYFDKCPPNHVCTADGAMRLRTKLNVEKICEEFNDSCSCKTEDKVNAVTSLDAGRYLCEYIYYTSLSVDSNRTLFVHVPDTNFYSSLKTALALEKILDLSLKQVDEYELNAEQVTEKLSNTNISDNKL